MKKKTVTVCLDMAVLEAARNLAKKEGRSLSNYLNNVLMAHQHAAAAGGGNGQQKRTGIRPPGAGANDGGFKMEKDGMYLEEGPHGPLLYCAIHGFLHAYSANAQISEIERDMRNHRSLCIQKEDEP